jgi:hypothetical protein
VILLVLAGCTPQFQHLNGHPFEPIAAPLPIDNGWVVFDSCAGGVHALIEIQVETDGANRRPPDLEQIAFRLASGYRWSKGQVFVEGPFCPWQPRESRSYDEVKQVGYRAESQCTYIVLAQFDLDRLPEPGDSVVVLHGERTFQIAWR